MSLEELVGGILERLEIVEATVARLVEVPAKPAFSRKKKQDAPMAQPATEEELRGRDGDPTAKRDPANWSGPSCTGTPFSLCSKEWLLEKASFLEWRANLELSQPDKAHYAKGSLKRAGLARGWALAQRSSKEVEQEEERANDDIPF